MYQKKNQSHIVNNEGLASTVFCFLDFKLAAHIFFNIFSLGYENFSHKSFLNCTVKNAWKLKISRLPKLFQAILLHKTAKSILYLRLWNEWGGDQPYIAGKRKKNLFFFSSKMFFSPQYTGGKVAAHPHSHRCPRETGNKCNGLR